MTVVTAGEPFPLGPGLLKIGATGTEIDVSCLVNNAVITASKDQGDSVTKLCGTVKVPTPSYTYELGGNMDTDIAEDTGFFALSQTAAGPSRPSRTRRPTTRGRQRPGCSSSTRSTSAATRPARP